MKLILNGGGSDEKTKLINLYFKNNIDINKPLLYIPLAMDSKRYSECLEWINGEMKDLKFKNIVMGNNANELLEMNLSEYAAIFIGGGNTFKLLSELKESGFFNILKEYVENEGFVFGGSAGAIIFGKDILLCEYMDKNEVELKNTQGFNLLNGYSLTAHYPNKDEIKTNIATEYLIEYSKIKGPVIALPEENSLIVENKKYSIIGTMPYYIFKNGKKIKYEFDADINLD